MVSNQLHNSRPPHSRSRWLLLLIAAFLVPVIPSYDMNGHINETAPPLVPIGEVKLVQVQIVVWFVRTCEVWIPFVLYFCLVKCMVEMSTGGVVFKCSGSVLNWVIVCGLWTWFPLVFVFLLDLWQRVGFTSRAVKVYYVYWMMWSGVGLFALLTTPLTPALTPSSS